jgi:hypothetical protein
MRSVLSDKKQRLNKLYRIVDKQKKGVTFKLNPTQEYLFENRWYPKYMGHAPTPEARFQAMKQLRREWSQRLFVTIEPVMDFDVDVLASWIAEIKPDFIQCNPMCQDLFSGQGIPIYEEHN